MTKFFQKLGKSLMLPVAVLPVASLMTAFGNLAFMFVNMMTNDGTVEPTTFAKVIGVVGNFFYTPGIAILGAMGVLFAIGVALGMSKKADGAAALSAVVGFLVVTNLLSPNSVQSLVYPNIFEGGNESLLLAFSKIDNVFVGIITGLVAARSYDKFNDVQLPTALSFFSGKRSVPIVTGFSMLFVSIILLYLWPIIFAGLVGFGVSISNLGALGAGIFGFANRLLIPTGLHHALNAVFWFDIAGINDIGNFLASEGTHGVTGMYQAGFFPIMMFGLPGACLAMYHTAKDDKRKFVSGVLLAGALGSFITGITEPIEFSFMFVAPALYVIHALLTGLSMFIAAAMQWTAGFAFSAGLIDFLASLINPISSSPLMLVVLGLVMFTLYYFIFKIMILKFDYKILGRDDAEVEVKDNSKSTNKNTKFQEMAATILKGLGGKDNIDSLDNCVTRLRIEVKDLSLVNEKVIKSAGISGIIKPGGTSIQVVIGTKVQFVADEIKNLL